VWRLGFGMTRHAWLFSIIGWDGCLPVLVAFSPTLLSLVLPGGDLVKLTIAVELRPANCRAGRASCVTVTDLVWCGFLLAPSARPDHNRKDRTNRSGPHRVARPSPIARGYRPSNQIWGLPLRSFTTEEEYLWTVGNCWAS
jgi:hypothetical protein